MSKYQEDKEILQNKLKRSLAAENPEFIEDPSKLTKEAIDKEIIRRLQDDKYDEYLVDGAILGCTSATWQDFRLSDGNWVHLDQMEEKMKQGDPQILLSVWENSLSKDGFRHATVTDTVGGQNIVPFFCNCREPAGKSAEQKIMNNMEECQKHGVCRYLINLEDEWENIDFDVPYADFIDNQAFAVIGGGEFHYNNKLKILSREKRAGITMTSVLFCKNGGFIYPMTSGQTYTAVKDEPELEEEPVLEEDSILDQSNPDSIKRYMWDFFRDAGFSEVVVAGILGNVEVESWGFKPDAIYEGGPYYGLFQYGGGREVPFIEEGKEWAKEHGIPEEDGWKDVRFQCEYALEDYHNGHNGEAGWQDRQVKRGDGSVLSGEKEIFENTTSVTDAALAWGASYERCVYRKNWFRDEAGKLTASEIQDQEKRLQAAQTIYDEFKE